MDETLQNKKMDICFNNLNVFIGIKWIITDRIPFQLNNSKTKPMAHMKIDSVCFDETKKAE